MRESTAKLPSGLVVKLRGTTLEEDGVLFDDSNATRTFLDVCVQLLNACTVEVIETGPHSDVLTADGKLDWDKVLHGDLMAGALALRSLSFNDGHLYAIDIPCPQCKQMVNWHADLRMAAAHDDGDIIDYPMGDDVAQTIAAGGMFEADVAERQVRFRLRTVGDMRSLQKLSPQEQSKARAIMFRKIIGTIENIDNTNDYLPWLSKLESADAQTLQDALDRYEPGID